MYFIYYFSLWPGGCNPRIAGSIPQLVSLIGVFTDELEAEFKFT